MPFVSRTIVPVAVFLSLSVFLLVSCQDGGFSWRNVDLRSNPIPVDVVNNANGVHVKTGTAKVDAAVVFYREAHHSGVESSNQTMLFLHGAAFSSQTWAELGTLNVMAAAGHRVVAVDLPGFGESPRARIANQAQFLKALISELHLRRPVLVSPSMSGSYSLRLLKDDPLAISGFVPVAPVGTNILSSVRLETVTVPTLIVYGEKDRFLGFTSRDVLKQLPNSKVEELPDSGHPAYLDQPELWHTLLYNFMESLSAYENN